MSTSERHLANTPEDEGPRGESHWPTLPRCYQVGEGITKSTGEGAVDTSRAAALQATAGRPARIAMLVYNDAHNDARVIKEAQALRQAGATVRVFAVARARAGYPEGDDQLTGGIDVTRSPEFSLQRQAPRLLNLARRLAGRPIPASEEPATLRLPASGEEQRKEQREQAHMDQPHAPAQPTTPAAPSGDETLPATAASVSGSEKTAATASAITTARVRQQARDIAWDVWMRTYRVASLSLYWLDVAKAVLEWQPDVVHANDANTLAPALWVTRHSRAALVYDSHELWRHRNVRRDRPIAPLVETGIETLGMKHADAVITVSPSIVTWLKDHYSLIRPPALVRNIPAAGPLPDRSRGRLRTLAGLDESAQVIAYGGRITTSRGIEETLAALALLPQRVHLVMLGYGDRDYIETLWCMAEELGVRDRVHQVGPVAPHEVADALSDGDVSVVHVRPTCLSYRYALPNKLFESIRAGLPVVAADLPDLATIVSHYGVGELFPEDGDAQSLADTLAAVLAHPASYRQAALEACPQLTWEAEAATLIEVYRQVLLGKGA